MSPSLVGVRGSSRVKFRERVEWETHANAKFLLMLIGKLT